MTVPQFHHLYCQLTGRDLTLDYMKQSSWCIWMAYRKHQPFTPDDLKLVIRFLKRQILAGERKGACLKFANLIGSPDYFEDDLQDARAWARMPAKPSAKAVALRSAGLAPGPTDTPAKSAEQILKEAAFIKQHLAEWRKANT